MPPRKFRRKHIRRRKRRMPIVKLIKKVITSQAEHKYFDQTGNSTSLEESLPFVLQLNQVFQGTQFKDRLGVVVNPTRLKVRYQIVLDDAGIDTQVRVYVIQDLQQLNPDSMPSVLGFMPPLTESLRTYRILYDRTHELSLGVLQNHTFKINIKGPKMINTHWSDNVSTNIIKGRIRLFFVTKNTEINKVSVSFVSRFYFTDD